MDDALFTKPTAGNTSRCAYVAIGHTAALLSKLMNSRRLTFDPEAHGQASYRGTQMRRIKSALSDMPMSALDLRTCGYLVLRFVSATTGAPRQRCIVANSRDHHGGFDHPDAIIDE